MWLRLAQNQTDFREYEDLLQKIVPVKDPEKRYSALASLVSRIYRSFTPSEAWDFIQEKVRPLQKQADQELRAITGEPELNARDADSIDEWLSWAENAHGNLGLETLLWLSETLDEHRFKNNPLAVKEVGDRLLGLTSQALGLDPSKLSDPEKWKLSGSGFVKLVNYDTDEGYGEGSIVQFFVDPDGLGILAEVSDPMPIEFQKEELKKVLGDLRMFPENWQKEVKYIEGADFQDILSGGLEKDIQVFRMMSFDEFNAWERGAEIPAGKFFAAKRSLAQGTDFGSEGDRDVFSFRAKRNLFSGDLDNVLRTNVPTKLLGKTLIGV
jgi:hypothetical protein